MAYCFTKTIDVDLKTAEEKITGILKENGFGILTEIDVSATFKKKIDKELYPYKILGACNPEFAYQAIKAEDKIGVMLPCNVILQEKEKGRTTVSAVDPMASMQAVENESLGEIAKEVKSLLEKSVESLS